MAVDIPFRRDLDFNYGEVRDLSPLVRRVIAENPSLFTFHGTGTYIVGRGEVAIIDPGPDLAGHVTALLDVVKGETVSHILITHTHRDHSPAAAAIKQATGAATLSFTPVLAPMSRGILATVTATRTGAADPRDTLAAAYADSPFVHVLPEGEWPRTAATLGSNSCHLQATVDADSGRLIVVSAIDNLGKGAAGQAVQCANLMLGLPETAGLSVYGGAP